MYVIIAHSVAAIVLLLWAVRMVRTAVERAYSTQLRKTLNHANDNRIGAALAGTIMAVALQSSTAVAALAGGFAAGGLMPVATGLALMLGAYLGSALVASVLSVDLGWLTPVLIIIGGTLFLRGASRQAKQTGRLILGVGFVLLSLDMMSEATLAWRESDFQIAVMTYLKGDLWTTFLIAALATWASYSSVASILIIVAFTTQGIVPVEVAAAFVLGANLGGTLIPLGMTRGGDIRAWRIAVGSLCYRGGAALISLLLIQFLRPPFALLPGTPSQQVVMIHILFNATVLIVGLGFTPAMARFVEWMCRDQPPQEGELNIAKLRAPALSGEINSNVDTALASATRELLRMSEMVEVMLQPIMDIYQSGDKLAIRQIRMLESEVNQANKDIKFYLTRLDWERMDAEQTQRASDLTSFAINLEQAGDIIAKNLIKLAEQKNEKALSFSEQGWDELTELHRRVLVNMQLALNVLISVDTDSARELIAEKDEIGAFERASIARHFKRLRSGALTSIESSDLHLETIHALKRINSLMCGIAYSILSDSGHLLDTRLSVAVPRLSV